KKRAQIEYPRGRQMVLFTSTCKAKLISTLPRRRRSLRRMCTHRNCMLVRAVRGDLVTRRHGLQPSKILEPRGKSLNADQHDQSDILTKLQEWYLRQCDGEWEHGSGVSIDTIDNPGWAIDIDLRGTALAGIWFEPVDLQVSEDDW